MTYISVLDHYKAQVQAGSYKATFHEFSGIINQRWDQVAAYEDSLDEPYGAFFNTAINQQVQDQLDLMALVQKIHRSEQSIEVQGLLQSGISVKKALAGATHCGRAYGIYLLPGSNPMAAGGVKTTEQDSIQGETKENKNDLETIVIGDLHSDAKSLQAALIAVDFFDKVATRQPIRLVFLGDYVDRGKEHLQILDWILALKYVFPHHVYLLRGNHDGGYIENNGTVKTPYRIPDEDEPLTYFPPFIRALELRNQTITESLLPNYLAFFESLAMAAAFKYHGKVYLACHGGILRPTLANRALTQGEMAVDFGVLNALEPGLLLPKSMWYDYLDNLSCLTRADALDEVGRSRIQNLYWSDPTEKHQDLKWHTGRFQFTEEHFRAYAEKLEFDVLLRGHQVVEEGVHNQFGGDCKTIYSTGGQLLMGENPATAYGEVLPKVGVITENGFKGRRI